MLTILIINGLQYLANSFKNHYFLDGNPNIQLIPPPNRVVDRPSPSGAVNPVLRLILGGLPFLSQYDNFSNAL